MYFWKIDKVIEEIRNDTLSQKDEFKYMLTYTLMSLLLIEPYFQTPINYNIFDSICSFLFLVVSVFGLWHCFKVNSSIDDKDFIKRVMCIGLPAVFRIIAVLFPVFIVALIIEELVFPSPYIEDEIVETTLGEAILIAMLGASYYYYLGKKIKSIAGA